MTCLKKIQNTEVYGSKFSSRTLTTAGDISGYTFKAVVKNIIQGKILEIAEDEMLIDALRTVYMENPYWDFDNEVFYDKLINDEETN